MKRLKLIAISLTLIIGVIISGTLYFKIQEKNRERTFNIFFNDWFAGYAKCGAIATQRQLLVTIAPNLSNKIRTTNAAFSILAQKEEAGTLSVQERETYLATPWRIISPNLFGIKLNGTKDDKIIKRCFRNGWHLKNRDPLNYCDAYVSIKFEDNERRSYSKSNTGWTQIKRAYYSRLTENGEIEQFLDELIGVYRKNNKLEEVAKESVLALPASTIPTGKVDLAVKHAYEKLKCDEYK